MTKALRCLNCGAIVRLASVSTSRRFAKCEYCQTIHNVGEFFASEGRKEAELTANADIARAEAEIPSGIQWLMLAYGKILLVAMFALYYPAAVIAIFPLSRIHGMPDWPILLVLAICMPLVCCPVFYWMFHWSPKAHKQ